MNTAGAGLTAEGKALLEEDLRSPCTEEIAVFRAFAQAVAEVTEGFVVLDCRWRQKTGPFWRVRRDRWCGYAMAADKHVER
jgi:hypothetical protein